MRLAIYFNTHDNKNQEADVYILSKKDSNNNQAAFKVVLNSEKRNTYDKHMFNQPNNRCLIYHGSLDVYFSFKKYQ